MANKRPSQKTAIEAATTEVLNVFQPKPQEKKPKATEKRDPSPEFVISGVVNSIKNGKMPMITLVGVTADSDTFYKQMVGLPKDFDVSTLNEGDTVVCRGYCSFTQEVLTQREYNNKLVDVSVPKAFLRAYSVQKILDDGSMVQNYTRSYTKNGLETEESIPALWYSTFNVFVNNGKMFRAPYYGEGFSIYNVCVSGSKKTTSSDGEITYSDALVSTSLFVTDDTDETLPQLHLGVEKANVSFVGSIASRRRKFSEEEIVALARAGMEDVSSIYESYFKVAYTNTIILSEPQAKKAQALSDTTTKDDTFLFDAKGDSLLEDGLPF